MSPWFDCVQDEPSLKRDREADTQVEHPLKKLALAQYNKEAMGASTGPPPLKKLALAQYHKDPNNSKVLNFAWKASTWD